MADGANLGTATGAITLDITGLSRAISQATKELQTFESRSGQLGSALDGVARSSAIIGGGIAVGIGAAVKTFASFEQQMSGVAASLGGVGSAAGITQEQMTALTDAAKRIGADTSFSATEAAAAMDVLAKAGIDANDIINGVADASVNLAAAIGEGIPQSAEAIAASLSIFSLSADDAAAATDTMTAAINASQTDLTGFVAGLRNLGPQMANLGISFEDTAAAIAYFTKFGLKGADVGISLARAIDNLAKPTDEAASVMEDLGIAAFDAQGNFVGFPDLMDQLNRALAGASDATKAYALQTVFGAEAADVMAIAVREGGEGLREMTQQVQPAGQAATQAAQRLDNLSGSLEKMRGSVETAAISFGSALAPAIEQGAGLVETLANAFSNLPAPVQQTAAAVIAAAGGFALLTAATAKTISFAIEAVASFGKMADAIRNSQRAMALLSATFSPAGLAVAGLAVGLGILAYKHQKAKEAAERQRQAIAELKASLQDFAKVIADMRLNGLDEAADAAELLMIVVQNGIQVLHEQADAAQKAADEAEKMGGSVGVAAEQVDDLTARQKALIDSLDDMKAALQKPGVDAAKLSREFTSLVNALLDGTISADEFTERVTYATTHLDQYAAKADDATQATTDLTQAAQDATDAAEEAAEAYRDWLGDVDAFTTGVRRQLAGLDDMSSELDGLQTGYQRVGESIEDALLRMDRLDRLDLSDSQEEALHLVNRLHDVEQSIADVNEQIANNQDDLSMWEGRISTVTDVLGGNTDQLDEWLQKLRDGKITQEEFNAAVADPTFVSTFDKLDALYESGAISQKKYNDAKAAGIHLLQRSAGGIEDENAELVDNLIALDEYVKAHDDANGAVNNLTEAQRGFVAAIQSASGLLFLQTLQVLTYLAATGQIPEEKVTKFIADSADADPVVAALIEDLGLLDTPIETEITITGNAQEQLGDVKQGLADLPPETTVAIKAHLESPNLTGGEGGLAQAWARVLSADTEVTIATAFGPPDTSAVDEATPPDVDVPTKLDEPDDTAVTGYKPETIHVPTVLDAPDATALTAYKPATIHIPAVIDAPTGGASTEAQAAVHIPTVLDAPDAAALEDLSLLPVIVPTVFGMPDWPEGAVIQEPSPVIIPVKADTTDFDTNMTDTTKSADTFAGRTFSATLDADNADYLATEEATRISGAAFDSRTFKATLDADNQDFYDSLAGVENAARAFANSTYSTTLDANIQPALNAIDELAAHLPSSPAEKGPLSKVPDWDYLIDPLVSSLTAMVRATDESMGVIADSLTRQIAGADVRFDRLMTDSLRGAGLNALTMGGLSGVPVSGRGGASTVVNNTQLIALSASDLQRVLEQSGKGGAAYDWILDGARYN
jgi:TP901 family phage tail tape measure protein